MRYRTMYAVFIVLATYPLQSQNTLDIGNQWIFEYNTYLFGIGIYQQSMESITVLKDTTINNVVYKKLVATKEDPCLVFDETEYLREDGGKIFRLSRNHESEFLMIDYDETTSYVLSFETSWSGGGPVVNGTAIIDSFGTEQTPDGSILDIQYMRILNNQSFDDDAEYKVVRGVGFVQYGLLFPNVSTGLCDVFEGIRLRCFISGQDTIHFTEFDCYESSLPSATRDVRADDVLVYPNPTTGTISIPPGFDIVDVIDMRGQKQTFFQDGNVIGTEGLTAGLYILMLREGSNGRVYFSRVLKL